MSRSTTTRLLLSKPTPGTGEPYDPSIDAGSNWDKVDGAISATICTASTRPTGADAYDGRIIKETDTGKVYYRHDPSGTWRQIPANTGASVPIDDDVSITGTLSVSSSFSNGNAAANVQVFTADGTWTKPSGAKTVIVEAVGGGGGSGGTAATTSPQVANSSGGGGGAYARKVFAASALGATEAVVVGAGGTAGTSGNNAGGAGGDSTFDSVTAGGGSGGQGSAAQTNTANAITGIGGSGGTATGGDLNVVGDSGEHGMVFGAEYRFGGRGGGSGGGFGGGVNSATTGGGAVGTAGRQYGGGASGSRSSGTVAARAGAAGASGVVVVTTLFD